MPDDPIEKLSVELEIYGIPQPPDAPPMTDTYLHVRRRQDGAGERAVMGLPAYQGEQGPPGRPGAIHQGERTTAELEALKTALGTEHTNWAYRNTDTNDQYVWTGSMFVIYHGVYATPGPVGPAPTMRPGDLTINGQKVDDGFGVRIGGGSAGSYSIGLDLPPMPKGDKGDAGPSGSIYDSVDVDQDIPPTNGDVLAYNAETELLEWSPGGYWIEEYVVPPSGFPDVSKSRTDTRAELVVVTIPAKTFPYRLDFTGGVDINAYSGHQVDIEIRRDNATTGTLVGIGIGSDGGGWSNVAIRAFSDVAIDPSNRVAVIEPGTPITLYVAAVKRAGTLRDWSVRSNYAQLRVRLLRVR
ncbi:hypothetical protein [Gordonia sihwensis]|uniref:hypothetical protein n=1 Tax=Gordonia sihwensis TaxID=173559 RepID=UPI002417E310|nr:hypothetical protein [Gordonia sihwensis]WFN94186.1 hypothetical protein P5P27_06465 [Gordonia sihwensis]WFN94247.1 hypothetical protein P5P27_06775 [Gordonia sihwensis]